jgi:hypothetical protein
MAQPVWITSAGQIGSFPSGSKIIPVFLEAEPVAPATSLTFAIISGNLPDGLQITDNGIIYGISNPVFENTISTFVVRITDNLGNINDRTFSILMSGIDAPEFTTPAGNILTTIDSIWTELQIEYTNPIPNTDILIRLIQGKLPPGLEINQYGLIRGYPEPPIYLTNAGLINTSATETKDNTIICYNTSGFFAGRPINFTGDTFGGIVANFTYYVKSVINSTTFTISTSVDGPTFGLENDTGYMNITLPDYQVGTPTKKTYSFTLKLQSAYGSSIRAYRMVIINQNLPIPEGGPGRPIHSRIPTALNTRPLSYNIYENDINYNYYSFPPNSKGTTYPPNTPAYIGKYSSDNLFSFRILGYDFDEDDVEYVFTDLPNGLTGDTSSGWITGYPIIADNSIGKFEFNAAVRKRVYPSVQSPFYSFSFYLRDNVGGDIIWLSNNNLGTIFNDTTSVFKIQAVCDLDLQYTIDSGSLPPNLVLQENGEITGVVAFQPTTDLLEQGDSTTFTFTVKAYSPNYPVVNSTKEFTITVFQKFSQPMDTLYIKCTPSVEDRDLLASLLNNTELIPNEFIYRPDDSNFGKASSIIYEHAYGINASNFDEYVAAVTKNHYWRNITLGELRTAIARDENTGEIIYEVLYSVVYDNLVNYNKDIEFNVFDQTLIINPNGVSISKQIDWPRPIPLYLGQWYTSETNLYTSYIMNPNGQDYYTSLTPGFAQTLYPNSLPNMRQQVIDELGQEQNTYVLPLWMTSQQLNGSSLGFTPAWVICYTKPRRSYTTQATQTKSIDNIITVDSTEGFIVNKPLIFTGKTYGNIVNNQTYYIKQIVSETEIIISETIEGQAYTLVDSTGSMDVTFLEVAYSEIIKENIENNWTTPAGTPFVLNKINFKIDRFTVDKSTSYDYDNNLNPPAWIGLPSATPVPDPKDSKNFYVWFPRQTILSDKTQ